MNYAEKQMRAGFTLIPRYLQRVANSGRSDLSKAAGFTLIEIMIAVAILGILAALTIPAVTGYLAKARKRSAESTVKVLEQAITVYNADTGQYPETLRDLVKKPASEKAAANWQDGGYLKKKEVPLDPWGRKYQYRATPDAENPYELYSYGPKGKSGPKSARIDVWKI